MPEFLDSLTSWPGLVATVMLLVCCLYWLVVMVSGLGFDLLDVDLDVDADLEVESVLSFGMVVLRWLNIGNVPIMIWLTLYSLSFWVICVAVDWGPLYENLWLLGGTIVGGLAASTLLAKLMTQPLKGKFDPKEPTSTEDLIGQISIIKTPEATQTSGQAEVRSDAAPLLLNVRTVQGVLAKGDEARIVDYDDQVQAYLVEKVGSKAVDQSVV